MKIVIPPEIEQKIGTDDHGNVTRKEVEECFINHSTGYALDHRPEHQSKSGLPSFWFVAETNHLRCLKIMFVFEDGAIFLKSAYPANEKVKRLFAGRKKRPLLDVSRTVRKPP
jgi:hypothetical protein